MSKIKRFLKMHYKKFVTVITVTVLCFVVLISQVFAVQYSYKLLDDYRYAFYDSYWTEYRGVGLEPDLSNYEKNSIAANRDPTNNRFVAYPVEYSGSYDQLFRFDLSIRFLENEVTFKKFDVLEFNIHLSSNCRFYTRSVDYPDLSNGQFYLKFFRVWFEDSTTMVFYPKQVIHTANQVNDVDYHFVSDSLTVDKPRIATIQFSFNMVNPVAEFPADISSANTDIYYNIWFNDYVELIVHRDLLSQSYTPPNNDSINNHNKIEQGIHEDISGGLEDTNIIFENFNSMSDESRLTRGMLFITQLMSRVFALEAYDILGDFSLAIGLVGFLLGLATLVKGAVTREEQKRERDQEREDLNELREVYRYNNRHRR